MATLEGKEARDKRHGSENISSDINAITALMHELSRRVAVGKRRLGVSQCFLG